MSTRSVGRTALALAGVLALGLAANPAALADGNGWGHGKHKQKQWRERGYYYPNGYVVYEPRPVYAYPPPVVYMAPPPVVYAAPPPVYVYPRPRYLEPSISITLPLDLD